MDLYHYVLRSTVYGFPTVALNFNRSSAITAAIQSMAPSKKSSTKLPSSNSKKPKKEKIFHPQSRKAGQFVRTHIRKSKLQDLARKRSQKQSSQGARLFFLLLRVVRLLLECLTWT